MGFLKTGHWNKGTDCVGTSRLVTCFSKGLLASMVFEDITEKRKCKKVYIQISFFFFSM